MDRLFVGPYRPSKPEAEELAALGIDPDLLLEFDRRYVWRHTLTRPHYQRWADVRLRSTFRLLDMKRQLMDADRVALVGAANYILVIKKGDKDQPARAEEIDNLRENINMVAKVPVIIGDHRLSLEIVTPALDNTLNAGRYDLLDGKILQRCLGTFATSSTRGDKSVLQGRVLARGLENRRWMIKRFLEAKIARQVMEANPDTLDDEPNLVYRPRNVAVDIDPALVEAVLKLRTMGELSRETQLEEFGFDQDVEAQRREYEEERYDEIFKSAIPFSSPATNPIGPTAQPKAATPAKPKAATPKDPAPQATPKPDVNRGRPRLSTKPSKPDTT
jgi:hypothetical protein